MDYALVGRSLGYDLALIATSNFSDEELHKLLSQLQNGNDEAVLIT